jgi:hypothetical protein
VGMRWSILPFDKERVGKGGLGPWVHTYWISVWIWKRYHFAYVKTTSLMWNNITMEDV